MKNFLGIATFIILISIVTIGPASAMQNDFTYIAADSMPQSYMEQGVQKGYAAELLMEIWDRMGIKHKKIQLMPWSKAYELALKQPKTVLLTTTRLEERESLFKWVGPISSPRFMLFADRNRGIRPSTLEEARKYRIGTVINDATEMLLLKRGFTIEQFDRSREIKIALERMQAGKFDLLAYSEVSMKQSVERYGYDAAQIVTILPFSGSSVFYAFPKDTPDAVIKSFQEVLNALKADGTYITIKKKYGFYD